MPWIAVQDGKKVGPEQVAKGEDAKCHVCGENVRPRAGYKDGPARHFWHYERSGGNGGGGACDSVAESDKHIKWKSLAASQLQTAFESEMESVRIEQELAAPKTSKDRRIGDVVLTFKQADQQLGKGLVVEVQHKNNSKDIDGVTRDYLEQRYAVAWLSSADFTEDRCKLTEVDFRKRARQAVDPKFYPDQSDRGVPAYTYRELWKNWRTAYKMGLPTRGSKATLPPDWFDEKAEEIWQSQPWGALFNQPKSYTDIWCYSKVPATIVKAWVKPTQKQYWNSTEWRERFQGTHDFLEIESADFSLEAEVPFEKYIESSDGARLINAIRDAYDSGRFQRSEGTVRRCPHCDVCEVHDPIHDGEIKRTTTCSSCGEWYTVWDKTGSESPNC